MNYFPEIREIQERPGYRICTRCVMDTTHELITFDAAGVCHHCRAHAEAVMVFPTDAERERRRLALVAFLKSNGQDKDYDCLLGLSGGADSSYLACLLKSWGLRTLAVQFDNGWNSELAVKNIELLCRKLGIDLHTHVVDWVEFRDLQLAFLRAGVANVEAPSDHGIFATLYAAGKKFQVHDIVSGVNFATEHTFTGGDYGWNYSDLPQLKAIHRKFSTTPLRTFPTLSYARRLYYTNLGGFRSHQPLNLIDYNKPAAIKYLIDEIGWKPYAGKHGESVITRFHQAYILPKKFRKDKRIMHLSDLIRSGQATRAEALESLSHAPYDPFLIEQDKIFVVKKFGISEAEFDAIMAAPPHSYREYANEEWLYNLVPWFVKLKRAVVRKRA